jgi:outer membrane cobalamin receptor
MRKEAEMKKLIKILLILCVSLSIISFSEEVKEKAFDLGEVEITATKTPHLLEETPGIVSVITKEEIETKKVINFEDLFEEIGGIKVNSYGWLGSLVNLSLRGSSDKQVLILIDGRPLNTPSLGSADLSILPLLNIDRVEIAKGPFSSLYGGNALGGVINIITKSPEEKFGLNYHISYGRFDTSILGLSFGEKKKNFGYLFEINKNYTDGFRENSESDYLGFSGKLFFNFTNNSEMSISAGYYNSDTNLPGSLTYPTPYASQKLEYRWIDLNYDFKGERFDLKTKFYFNYNTTIYKNDDPNWPSNDKTENAYPGINIQTNFYPNEFNIITTGIDYKTEKVNVIDRINNVSRIGEERKRDNIGIFLQDEITFGKLKILPGIRWDNNSDYESFLSPKIASLIKIGENTNLRLSFGRSFTPPSIDDLYWYEDWGWGMGLFGNPNLKPEKANSFDLGIEHIFGEKILSRINLFHTKTKDLISWVETSPYRWRWEAQNIDKSEINGIETEFLYNLNKNFSISLHYTYMDARDKGTQYNDKKLTYRPENKLSLGLNFKNEKGIKFNIDLNFVDDVYTDRENTKKLDDYTILNTTISKEFFKNSEFFIQIRNLLDEEYQIIRDYPMPGRIIMVGFKGKI